MYGWKGTILKVDLGSGEIAKEELPSEWREKYIGCRGINDILLYREVGPNVDPFSPENIIVFGTGPLEGTPIGMGRISIQTKHPKNFIGEGGAGGHWGAELKYAGYDCVVIKGKSQSPVYIYINDDVVEIRDASHLWGRDVREKSRILRNETGLPVEVACIGPGGERLVSDSKVMVTLDHSGGRGCGVIMGDKKLAAVAVHGTGGVKVKRPDRFLSEYRELRKKLDLKDTIDAFVPSWAFMSANMLLPIFNENGWLHAYNAQRGTVPTFLCGEEYLARYVVRPESGFCCPFPACGRRFEVKKGKYAGTSGDEREGGFAIGAAIVGISSWPAMLKFREICSLGGIDEFMVLYTIGWAMECFEKGIIGEADTDGIDLRFGNEEAFIEMTQKILLREGFGDILARGSEEASKIIGKGSERFLLTIKGRELEVMPQRGGYQMALALAVCEGGPDHTRWYPPYPPNPRSIPAELTLPFDVGKAFQTRSVEDKGRLVKWLYDSRAVLESLPTCVFIVRGTLGIDMKTWLGLYNSCTGADCTLDEFIEIGERIVNLERAYIVREGFRREHDTVPRRMLEEPIIDRNIPPLGDNLKVMLDDYYGQRGWDEATAIPKEPTLRRLGLDFVVDDIMVNRPQ